MTAEKADDEEHLGDHLDGGEERLVREVLNGLVRVPRTSSAGTAPEVERVGHPQVPVGELAREPLRRVLSEAVLHVRVAEDVAGAQQEERPKHGRRSEEEGRLVGVARQPAEIPDQRETDRSVRARDQRQEEVDEHRPEHL
jgi:hypothetical protein